MRKVSTVLKSLATLGIGAALGLTSCGGEMNMMPVDPTPPVVVDQPSVPALPFAFEHDGSLSLTNDPFKDGLQVSKAQSEISHSCGKLTYKTLGTILSKRGVNMSLRNMPCTDAGGTFDCLAGDLYSKGNLVLGIANYPARAAESDRSTTGGIVRLDDILIAAAIEIIPDNMDGVFGATTECAGTRLYNGNACDPEGMACFVGVPLTQTQLDTCNASVAEMVRTGLTATTAKRLTLAAMAATIYLCD